jgi:hypothetical protein
MQNPESRVSGTTEKMQAMEIGKTNPLEKKVFWSQHVASITREFFFVCFCFESRNQQKKKMFFLF